MLVMAAESYPGPGLSPGRIDQYLYPYYQGDLAAGRLDREQARELLHANGSSTTTPTTNQAASALTRASTPASASSSPRRHRPDGEDASNDLTRLMLDVIEDMNLLEPKPNIRLHQKTPDDLLRRVAGLIARAQGSPFLLNFDEAAIRGWSGRGYRRPPLGLRARGLPGEHPPGLRPLRHRRCEPEHR